MGANMTYTEHIWDIIVRSAKTALAAYAAFLAAGGFNVLHVDTTVQIKIAALAALATALLNVGLKVHTAITSPEPATLAPTIVTPQLSDQVTPKPIPKIPAI